MKKILNVKFKDRIKLDYYYYNNNNNKYLY